MSTESHGDGVTCRRRNHLPTSDRGGGERGATDGLGSVGMCSAGSVGMRDVCVCVCCLLVVAVRLWLLYIMRAVARRRSVRNNLFTPSPSPCPSPCPRRRRCILDQVLVCVLVRVLVPVPVPVPILVSVPVLPLLCFSARLPRSPAHPLRSTARPPRLPA
jgi:hypothetical protein